MDSLLRLPRSRRRFLAELAAAGAASASFAASLRAEAQLAVPRIQEELNFTSAKRIGAVNGSLNAAAYPIRERALEEARRADARLGRGEHMGPLHGVRCTIKDSLATAGVRTATFTELLVQRDAWRSRMMGWVKDFDLIISSPALGPAPKIGDRAAEGVRGGGFTTTYNIAGYPCGVVLAGTSPENMPPGVMRTVQPWRKDIVLAAMQAIEGEFGGWQPPS